jgi:membrane associated rhomboid family serine protease
MRKGRISRTRHAHGRGAIACRRRRGCYPAAVEIHVPDPAHTTSERARANFRLAVKIAAAFVGLAWLIQLTSFALDVAPLDIGVRPRHAAGLWGILCAPLIHGGFEHLIANTPALMVAMSSMLYLYPRSALRVLPAVYFGPGIAVWLFARGGVHVGSSGIIYGIVAYIVVAGFIRRDRRAIGASLLVCFLYGTLVWGVLPIERGVSWETHLAAALIGVVLAVALRRLDVPPRRRYAWEDEEEEANAPETAEPNDSAQRSTGSE